MVLKEAVGVSDSCASSRDNGSRFLGGPDQSQGMCYLKTRVNEPGEGRKIGRKEDGGKEKEKVDGS